MKTISVVVPVHNTKAYIRECIDSICNQTYKNLEIICLDSSTDETTAILEEMAKNDSRIRHIIDANSSYGYKVNRGIKEATGEYIGIIDSDDYIEENMYARLLEVAEKYKVDFVKTDHSSFYTQGGQNVVFRYDDTIAIYDWYGHVVSCEEIPEVLYRNAISIWSGLYRADFLKDNHIIAHESAAASYQDAGFSVLTYLYGKRIYHLRESYYRYRTDNANSSVKSAKKVNTVIDEFHWIEDEVEKRQIAATEGVQRALKIKKLDAYFWNFDRLNSDAGIQFAHTVREELERDLVDAGIYNEMDKDKQQRYDYLYHAGSEKTDNTEISVIIPVYNTEDYLEECLESVLNQNGVLTEIICVNDGSTDGSLDILKEYQERDDRIVIVDQKNGGLSCARNAGLRRAKGKYILFLDSDDKLREYALLELLIFADTNQTDIVCFDAECLYETEHLKTADNKDYYYQRPHSFGLKTGKELFTDLIAETGDFCDSACLMLLNREWMKNNRLRFIPGVLYEDSPFSVECMMKAERAMHTNSRYYIYRVREKSIMTSSYSVKNLYGRLVGYDHLRNFLCKEPMTSRQRKSFLVYMNAVNWSGGNIASSLSESEKSKIFDYPLSWNQIMELKAFGFQNCDVDKMVFRDCLSELFGEGKKAILYGAGLRTKRLLAYIALNGFDLHNLSIVVSERSGNPQKIGQVTVYALDEGYELPEDQPIVVALAGVTGKDTVNQLWNNGYTNVVYFNDAINAYIHEEIKKVIST